MKKRKRLKTILTIITIIIMIPVILASLLWLVLSLGVKRLLIKMLFISIKLTIILPIIKWGLFIVFAIWTLYGIINIFNKKQKSCKIKKI